MEIITAKELRKILRKQYPKLKHIWIFEQRLSLLPEKQVKKLLCSLKTKEYQFKAKLFECDAFAMAANAEVKEKISDLDLEYSWAFGQASMAYPKKGIHNMNIFITENHEIKLFEPQTNIIINPDNETVFFVRM